MLGRAELKPGAVVISNAFAFEDWEEELADEEHGIYVYRQAIAAVGTTIANGRSARTDDE